jgi:maleylpyruvate isomerase
VFLLSADLRAKAWSLAEGVNADIQPLHNLSVLNKITAMSSEEAKKEWAVWAVTNGLKALEAGVAEVGGKYCVGDAISIADVCLAPQMSAARRFDIDFSQYPRLVAVERLLNTHPAFIAGHANAQPDKPAGLVVP